MNDIEAFFTKKVCGFLGSVSAEDNQAVEAEFVVSLLHGFHFVEAFFIRHTHQLERLTGCSDDRSALGKDTREIFGCQKAVFAIDQAFIAILKTVDLHLVESIGKSFDYASHGSVECLTVAAAGQESDSFYHLYPPFLCCFAYRLLCSPAENRHLSPLCRIHTVPYLPSGFSGTVP